MNYDQRNSESFLCLASYYRLKNVYVNGFAAKHLIEAVKEQEVNVYIASFLWLLFYYRLSLAGGACPTWKPSPFSPNQISAILTLKQQAYSAKWIKE